MLKKLKRKFIIINMAFVSVIILLVFGAICAFSYRTERSIILRELKTASDSILASTSTPPSNKLPGKDAIFGNTGSSFSTVSVILDKSGEIKKAYYNMAESSATALLEEVCETVAAKDSNEGILWNYSLIYSRKITPDSTVISFTDLSVLTARLRVTGTVSGSVLCACLILFCVLSYHLAGIAIKPTERAWDAQRQFIQDASHDLKTPLTVILANNEIINSRPEASVGEVENWLDSTKEEAERMRRLVDSMLELAKTDGAGEDVTLADIDLSELTERTALQMEPIAFEKQVMIETDIEAAIVARSNADAFTRLTHILIDNGIKYAARNTTLRVTLVKERREARLSVTNRGEVISPEDLPHIFERFYRSDKARSGGEGFGLGLAIAKSLCEKMNGRISVESEEESGTKFTAAFPLS